MKKQAIVIHLNPPERIMKNYKNKPKTHITLVYPFKVSNQKKLEEHIKKSINQTLQFILMMKGLQKSTKEYYLYLLVKKGKEEIMDLYKKLNSGILSNFKNLDMPKYIPHVTLNVFKSKKEIDEAYNNPDLKNIKFMQRINKIDLITLKEDSSLGKIKSFKLK